MPCHAIALSHEPTVKVRLHTHTLTQYWIWVGGRVSWLPCLCPVCIFTNDRSNRIHTDLLCWFRYVQDSINNERYLSSSCLETVTRPRNFLYPYTLTIYDDLFLIPKMMTSNFDIIFFLALWKWQNCRRIQIFLFFHWVIIRLRKIFQIFERVDTILPFIVNYFLIN